MLFNSVQFLIFLPIVTLVYFWIPERWKHVWLLISSYYFYMCWNAQYALLMLFSTAVTYVCSLLMERIKKTAWDPKRKQIWKKATLAASLILNLMILGYFKYTNFAMEMLSYAFDILHIELNVPRFDILLPVGISFYTFQALGYTMDVYRDEIYAEKNFFRYALFVSYFPQLVAGPIERSKNLLKQLAVHQKFCFERAKAGIMLMLWGFFLKVVLADRTAIFVDAVYGDYKNCSGILLIVATVLFAVQIYCDFYGYSIIAKGTAQILGMNLMENFRAPYLSLSVAEFWRNWHISLTSWFKDYLYIPLGGSRKGTWRKYGNKLTVFLVSGLWHGADLSFVVWGVLNGLYQIAEEITGPVRNKFEARLRIQKSNALYKLIQMAVTFVLVDFSWIFFRADGIFMALQIIRKMLSPGTVSAETFFSYGINGRGLVLIVVSILILLLGDICKKRDVYLIPQFLKLPWWLQGVSMALIIYLILLFGVWGPGYEQANFIYFQF